MDRDLFEVRTVELLQLWTLCVAGALMVMARVVFLALLYARVAASECFRLYYNIVRCFSCYFFYFFVVVIVGPVHDSAHDVIQIWVHFFSVFCFAFVKPPDICYQLLKSCALVRVSFS